MGFIIKRRGASVRLTGDSQTLAWVRARGAGYFEFAVDEASTACWHIIAGREHAGEFVSKLRGYHAVTSDHVELWLPPDERIVIVDVPTGPWRDLWALRMVRHILRWQLFHAGAIFLHGCAFAHDGAGVAALGGSRAGKTTVLLQSLRMGGVAFVAEDDLTILQQPSGGIVALGWPGSVRLRRSMLHAFPEFSRTEEFRHPANSQEAKLDPSVGLLRVFPEEIRSTFGCELQPEARLEAIGWVDWAPKPGFERMRTDELQAVLHASWDILPERRPGTRPQLAQGRLPHSREFCFHPFLHDIFGVPELGPFSDTLARYAPELKGYRVRHTGEADHTASLMRAIMIAATAAQIQEKGACAIEHLNIVEPPARD